MAYPVHFIRMELGEGDERQRMDSGHGKTNVSRQAEMEILGEGRMCSRHEVD